MKKIILSIAASLLCLLAHSQEADLGTNYAEVEVVPCLSLNPYYSAEDSEFGFSHGISSLYTYFHGSASEHFSWKLVNHWAATMDDIEGDHLFLYKNLGINDISFIDFCCVNLTFGSWDITLGKDMVTTLGYEYDDRWDWENEITTLTPLNMMLCGYQWGGKVAYTTPSEKTTFSLQMTTSPLCEKFFSDGLWQYSAQFRGDYGWFKPLWSFTAMQASKEDFSDIITLGNRLSFCEGLDIVLEYTRGFEHRDFSNGSNTIRAEFGYDFSEKLKGIAHMYYCDDDFAGKPFYAGAFVNWFPKDNLTFRGGVSYNTGDKTFGISAGVIYDLHIRCW